MKQTSNIAANTVAEKKATMFFSKANAGDGSFFQPKLTVGPTDDIYEREADAMADKVMRMQGSGPALHSPPAVAPIQRMGLQREEEEKKLQRKESGQSQPEAPSIVQHVARSGGGKQMDNNTLSSMENRFGYDFSGVKIHTGTVAAKSAQSISALAYTSGNNIVFNEGQYAPGTANGDRLLAHELTHTIQQGAASSPVIQRDEDPRIIEIRERLSRGGALTPEDVEYLRAHVGREIINQILGGSLGQILINFDPSRPPQDLHRRFQGGLELRLSGTFLATARSLEGTASADVDLDALLATERGTVTISPPTERNRLAAMIREILFPNDAIQTFDFDFPRDYFRYANAVALLGSIVVSLSGPDTPHTSGMIRVHSDSIPNGVELILTLSSTARETSVRDTPRQVPGNHWLLTPRPRLFGTVGYSGLAGSPGFGTTLGADFPLAYDTSNPLIYGGLGARGTFDSNLSGSVGGTGFVGFNFDPLLLQVGFGGGATFLPTPIMTPHGPAQTFVYYEVEGMAAYRVIPNLDLVLLLRGGSSEGSGTSIPYGGAQLGAGYHF